MIFEAQTLRPLKEALDLRKTGFDFGGRNAAGRFTALSNQVSFTKVDQDKPHA
jgi:hypothetical protein